MWTPPTPTRLQQALQMTACQSKQGEADTPTVSLHNGIEPSASGRVMRFEPEHDGMKYRTHRNITDALVKKYTKAKIAKNK